MLFPVRCRIPEEFQCNIHRNFIQCNAAVCIGAYELIEGAGCTCLTDQAGILSHTFDNAFHAVMIDIIPHPDMFCQFCPFFQILVRFLIVLVSKGFCHIIIHRGKNNNDIIREFALHHGREFGLSFPVCQGGKGNTGIFFCHFRRFQQEIIQRSTDALIFFSKA